MKRWIHRFRSLAVAGLCLTVLSPASAAERLRIAGNFPVDHSSSVAMERFAKAVEQRSDGAVTVQVFPAMQLGGASQNVDQVNSGAIFATWIGTAYLSRIVPSLEAVSLPFLFSGREAAFRVIDGKVGDELADRLRAKGFEPLGWMELGSRNVTNSVHPIARLEDFKGLKIRLQPDKTQIATFRALGANPVPMDIKEVYSALQQGVLDGQENPYSIILTRHFDEVQKYLSDSSHFFDFIVVVANKKRFDALPAKDRKIVRDAMADAVAYQREQAKTQSDEALAKLRKSMTFTHISDAERARMQAATANVVDEVRKRAGDALVDLVLSEAKGK